MSSALYLGVRLQLNQYQRIKLDNVKLDNKIDVFKDEVAEKLDITKQKIELIYAGIKLDDNSTLDDCGIKFGATIHVLEKEAFATQPAVKTVPDEQLLTQLVLTFKIFNSNSGYRAALQRLSRPEILEKIIAATPSLADDPAAISYIREPELIFQMSNMEFLQRLAKSHPSLIEAANLIASEIREALMNTSQNDSASSSGFSYSLDALSEDEDMEGSNNVDSEGMPLSRNSSYTAITSAQLAAAIANATSGSLNTSTLQTAGTSNSATGNLITSEMFTNAMQQAYSTVQQRLNPNNSTSLQRSSEDSFESMRSRFQQQLQQMQEIGLLNEAVNIRALQASTGDVQAAIELVLSGAFD